MGNRHIDRILRGLGSEEPTQAWKEFLQEYASLILRVIQHFENDTDHVADCFLFVCEQLNRNNFRRLQRFKPGGPAKFSTWLRAVVRNLCLDWHRQEFGRDRAFKSVTQLSALDQAVFVCAVERGASLEDIFLLLRPNFPDLTREQLAECAEKVHSGLTPRQRWILSVRQGRRAPAVELDAYDGPGETHADTASNPEFRASELELQQRLRKALAELPESERLLLQLRYDQELKLEQVARLLGLENAQQADRKIRGLLDRLRKEIG